MRRSLLVTLLAATAAFVPTAAFAQEDSGPRFRQREVRPDSGTPTQNDSAPRQLFRQERQERQAPPPQVQQQFQQAAPAPVQQAERPQFRQRPQFQPQLDSQPARGQFRQQQQGDAGQAFRQQRQGFGDDRRFDGGQVQNNVPAPAFQPDRQQDRPGFRRDGQPNGQAFGSGRPDNRQGFRPDQRGQGFGNDGFRRDGFRNDGVRNDGFRNDGFRNDGARNGWNGGNRGYDRRDNGNRGRWNRDWRNDRGYDWQSYRNYNRNAFNLPRYYAPYGWNYGYRRFSVGLTLSSLLFSQSYWIDDPEYYRLPPAYWPYQWVRYYNDALLVDTTNGYVVDTVYDIFW